MVHNVLYKLVRTKKTILINMRCRSHALFSVSLGHSNHRVFSLRFLVSDTDNTTYHTRTDQNKLKTTYLSLKYHPCKLNTPVIN